MAEPLALNELHFIRNFFLSDIQIPTKVSKDFSFVLGKVEALILDAEAEAAKLVQAAEGEVASVVEGLEGNAPEAAQAAPVEPQAPVDAQPAAPVEVQAEVVTPASDAQPVAPASDAQPVQ